jgi:hypothetical protein
VLAYFQGQVKPERDSRFLHFAQYCGVFCAIARERVEPDNPAGSGIFPPDRIDNAAIDASAGFSPSPYLCLPQTSGIDRTYDILGKGLWSGSVLEPVPCYSDACRLIRDMIRIEH